MASLSFEHLKKRYGETEVLKDVHLDVNDGEYLVLVGPSGCGKSTLLRCIAGLEEISDGKLHIGDRVVNELSPKHRNVAMVFQSYALYPHMTVRDNLGFALRVQKVPKADIRARVDEVAKSLELTELLERLPGQLSGGQRQRVAMGRAVVRSPDVFLFDEPLSNLDASLRSHMRLELKRLHRRLGTTIVHVTHDQVEALTLADRILVLNQGVVQQVGSPRELFDTPANLFVATFIGSPAMNILPVEGDGTNAVVADTDASVASHHDGGFNLGVRPTDWVVGEGPIRGTVEWVESLGAEALVHVEVGPHRVVVQVAEPTEYIAGASIELGIRTQHAFDKVTGKRLMDRPA
ncbi:MAG: sn-glycerol-3-phosphate ABC transporter ATP-binding protein UgpC [Proteobacteria bacterium]|nr:sn-glycerol-3-phosphate ABC transporter ATP-binding protein UgpC [Pseudomonadota bacterium]